METHAAFKEWETVCAALASGRQAIILRKGGIHEGRAGFSFAHEEFFLFPTRFHGQAEAVRELQQPASPEWQHGDQVPLTLFARAAWARTITHPDLLDALEPYHIWTRQTVSDRFAWQGKSMASGSIHCALLRIYQLDRPWLLEYGREFGGCRSWVEVGGAPAGWRDRLVPVIGDEEFAELAAELGGLVGVA